MARRVVIPPLGEVRLRHFTARNTRRGGGGEIDFIAYSPKGILWTDDLNKNQITCLHTDAAKLIPLPLPVGFPEFAGKAQLVVLWPDYCLIGGRCWQEVLHYDAFFTDVNVGSDSETGGYVMAKRNSSKTCDSFVSDSCMLKQGGEACMQAVIAEFMANRTLAAAARAKDDGVNTLVIALPVALGGAAVIAFALGAVLLVRRRRAAAAAAAAAARKLGDVEAAAAAAGGDLGGSKGVARGSLSSGSKGANSSDDLAPLASHPGAHATAGAGTMSSFKYDSGMAMGRCLAPAGGLLPVMGSGSTVAHSATPGSTQVEGVMDDGSTCVISVGPALGQGSYGVVFKGVWNEQVVAVKVIICGKAYSEQVANEARLASAEALRHPNLLRALACMTRTRLLSGPGGRPSSQAVQSLEATLQSLTGRRSGEPMGSSSLSEGGRATGANSDVAETWIVAEYCDLGALAPYVHTLKRFLEAGRPRMALILHTLRDIAAGMQHLHSLNVVHGDLKLANVLLSSPPGTASAAAGDGGTESGAATSSCEASPSGRLALPQQLPQDAVAKVADFGLSRWLKEGQTHHSTKSVGTVTHMPPELLRSGKLALSGDVYSFGIMMWEMLTGSVPYKGLLYGEVVERVVVSARRPEFPPHTPLSYRALAERCWAADAAARPTFAVALAELEAMAAAAPALQAESDAICLPSAGPSSAAPASLQGSAALGQGGCS